MLLPPLQMMAGGSPHDMALPPLIQCTGIGVSLQAVCRSQALLGDKEQGDRD